MWFKLFEIRRLIFHVGDPIFSTGFVMLGCEKFHADKNAPTRTFLASVERGHAYTGDMTTSKFVDPCYCSGCRSLSVSEDTSIKL